MSSGVFSSIAVGVAGTLQDVLLRQGRSIAGIIPQVIIEEQHTDDLMITGHPVEDGADITDHAVKQPSQVIMRCGWSKSGSNVPLLSLTQPGPKDAYKMLLDLQASRQPFDAVTGKRSYKNMLIKRLSTVTDEDTENVLIIDVELREVIIVNTSVTGGTVSVGDPLNLKNQAATSSLIDGGAKQLQDVTSSLSSSAIGQITELLS